MYKLGVVWDIKNQKANLLGKDLCGLNDTQKANERQGYARRGGAHL